MDLAQLGGPNLNSYKGAIFLQCSWYTTLLFLQFSCLFEVCREPNTPFSVVEKPSRIQKSKFQKYVVPSFFGEGLLLEEFRIPETYFNHNFSEQRMGFKKLLNQ